MSSWKWMAAGLLGGWLGTCALPGQNGSSSQAPAASDKPAAGEEAAPSTKGTGKVLFSRSDDEAAAESSGDKPPAAAKLDASKRAASSATAGFQATAEERDSLTFLTYDLDIRLS